MTREQALHQAQAEGLTLRKADNQAGYLNVITGTNSNKSKPFRAEVTRGGAPHLVLGRFATAEEAALCFARSPEGRAAERKAAVVERLSGRQLRREQALQQAEAEGLTLRKDESTSGYANVAVLPAGAPKPYQARLRRGGVQVPLDSFTTAEEAALCVARSLEEQAAAERVATAPPTTSNEEEEHSSARSKKKQKSR